jgi:hypothetical protein
MEPDFKNATSGQNYLAALVAASRRFFHRGNRLDCARGIIVPPPIAEHPASLEGRENNYQDPDPPTPNWGC